MPGYYVHLAGSNPKARNNRSFTIGVETPDLLKEYLNLYGLAGAREKYNTIKTNTMPDFSRFEERVQQIENKMDNSGMHYGESSNPDIWAYWSSLTTDEKRKPFFIGYLWHLLEDISIYKYLTIKEKLNQASEKNKIFPNYEELMRLELDTIHKDWDKTNGIVKRTYPDVILPPEIDELGVVKIIEDDKTKYVDWNIIKPLIDYFRFINPLETDMEETISEVMSILPSDQDYSVDALNKKLQLTRYGKQFR